MTDEYKIRGTKVTMPYPVKLTPGETRLVFSLQRHFAPEKIFVDLYLPKVDEPGQFAIPTLSSSLTQIDCVAVNNAGVFVYESKDFGGWIYGDETQRFWVQVLDFGREKHTFYSPLKQNALHVQAITKLVGKNIPIFSVVVFGNETVFKTSCDTKGEHYICLQSGIHEKMAQIASLTDAEHQLTTWQIERICDRLRRGRIIPDVATRQLHIDEVNYAAKSRRR